MPFTSLQEIIDQCENTGQPFFEIILQEDLSERQVEREASISKMRRTWEAVLQASDSYEPSLKSASGLVGGDGAKIEAYYSVHQSDSLCGGFVGKAVTEAVKMAESNACMKRIVAAPTAGSCGVLPAVLVPFYREKRAEEGQIIEAMYVAAGIGQVIAHRASISGAEGGCQAEIGSASAMAAGALVHLQGGEAKAIAHAAAIALKNMLGLVCDPVAGLVEVPCVKRNVIGAVNALSSADLAVAGVVSKIPPDQVIDAMKEIGDKMDYSLKETGKGGLAASPAAREIHL